MRNISQFTWVMGGMLVGFVAAALLFAAFASPGDGLGMLVYAPVGMVLGVLVALGVQRWIES
jgi:hypothetical protein